MQQGGAKMRSMLLLSRRPYFEFYLKLLRVALKRYFEAEQIEVLATLYNGLNGLSKSKAPTRPPARLTTSLPLAGPLLARRGPARASAQVGWTA